MLDTELDLLSWPRGLLDLDLRLLRLCLEDTPDSESVLELGLWDIELVLDPLGLVTRLLLLLASSRRLSPEPILSNRARALENLSWWDSVLWTETFPLFRSELVFRLLEDWNVLLVSLGMSDGLRLTTDGV